MSKNSIYVAAILTVAWVILRENFTLLSVLTGIIISAGCVYFCYRLFPRSKTQDINLFRFLIYLLFLLGQIYKAGFWAVKVTLKGARSEIIETKTKISSLFLRTILANSITLVPGSVSLEMKDDVITVLWLMEKNTNSLQTKEAAESIIGRLEKMLLKVQR